jgi:hypothetical protein
MHREFSVDLAQQGTALDLAERHRILSAQKQSDKHLTQFGVDLCPISRVDKSLKKKGFQVSQELRRQLHY